MLTQDEKDTCEGMLTEEECQCARKSFGSDKSPGNDGITVEFYKTFWTQLKDHLIQSLLLVRRRIQ